MKHKLSKYDLGLIKAALRRALSRSDLSKLVENNYKVVYTSDKNPRCKKWSKCAACGKIVPTWKTQKDHIEPVVPLEIKLEDMDPHTLLDRIWCSVDNFQVLCKDPCHRAKSKAENKLRRSRK